jgi:hypothetical protein
MLILMVALPPVGSAADGNPDVTGFSGLDLMEESRSRHRQFPFVHEKQTMVLVDRRGQRETRRLRRYSRVDADGRARFLLVFD